MPEDERSYWTVRGRLSRRAVVKGGVLALGGLGAAIVGCGSANNNKNNAAAPPSASAAARPSTASTSAPGAATAVAGATGTRAAATTAASPAAARTVPTGGSIIVAVGDAGSEALDTARWGADTNTQNCMAPFADWMIDRDNDGNLIPGLALTWKPAPDQGGWVVTLRKGVKWHNGDPFTAQDVVFGVERIRAKPDIAQGVALDAYFASVPSVQAIDDFTVLYKTKGPYANFPPSINTLRPVPKNYVQQVGDEAFNTDKPIGTGPFKFVSRTKGQEYKYEVNPDYWGQLPTFKSLTMRIIREGSTRLAALQAGEVDYITDVLGPLLTQAKGAGLQTFSTDGGAGSFMVFADREHDPKSPFNDVRVRQAVNYAIDRQQIAQTVFQGEALPAPYPDLATAFGMPPDLKAYPYDLAKAKQLLSAAGFPNGLNMTVALPNYISGSAPFLPQTCEALTGYLDKIGLQSKLDTIATATYVQQYRAKQLTGFPILGSGVTGFEIIAKAAFFTNHKQGYSWFDDADTQQIADAVPNETDDAKRKTLEEKFVHLLYDDARIISIVVAKNVFAGSKKIKQWRVPTGQVLATDRLNRMVTQG